MLGHQTCSVLLFFQPLTSFISFCFFSLIYLFRVEEGFELSLSEHVHICFALLLQLCKLHRKECLNLVQRIIHFQNILHNMSFLKLLSISCRSNGIFFFICMFLRIVLHPIPSWDLAPVLPGILVIPGTLVLPVTLFLHGGPSCDPGSSCDPSSSLDPGPTWDLGTRVLPGILGTWSSLGPQSFLGPTSLLGLTSFLGPRFFLGHLDMMNLYSLAS